MSNQQQQQLKQTNEDQAHKEQQNKIQKQLHCQTFAFKVFDPAVQNNEEDKLLYQNYFIYGKKISRFYRKGKGVHQYFFYMYEDDPRYIQWISNKKTITRSRIDLLEIQDIKDGTHWKINKNKFNQQNILHIHTPREDLVLLFENPKDKDCWHMTLIEYIKNAQDLQKEQPKLSIEFINHFFRFLIIERSLLDPGKVMAQKIFASADKDGSKLLSMGEVKKIFKQLHTVIPDKILKDFFQANTKYSNNEIDQQMFQQLLRSTMKKDEVQTIYINYSDAKKDSDDSNKLMILDRLSEFLADEMCEQYDEMDIFRFLEDVQMIDRFNKNQEFQDPTSLSLYQFTNLLFSMKNSIFNPIQMLLDEKAMDRPLTDYFINSSHNTYLEGDQLVGKSSTQAYINAFLKGCRCVELDIWDGNDGEPKIKHGFTLTSEILFRDAIKTMKSHGFQSSPYPLILSFENHCSKQQQLRMADIIKEEIGNIVFQVPEDADFYRYYPSPHKLQNKIIIKGKGKINDCMAFLYPTIQKKKPNQGDQQPKQIQEAQIKSKQLTEEDKKVNIDEDESELNDSVIYEVYHAQKVKERNYKRKCEKDDPNNKITMEEKEKKEDKKKNKKEKEVRGINELQQYFTMFGCTFKYNKDRHVMQISSLSEKKIIQSFNSSPSAIIDFHKKYLTRIYPSGMRFDSSNYDPYSGLIAGSQIVALNQQTSDLSMLWYMGLFQQNGGIRSGYVPKPSWMCSQIIKDKKEKVETEGKTNKQVKKQIQELYPIDFHEPRKRIILNIISAQQLNPASEDVNVSESVSPYIEVAVKGLPIDNNKNQPQRTEVVKNNGFNPNFSNKEIIFDIYCPDLAQIYFQVFTEGLFSNQRLGWYSLPVNCIRQGFRVVPLWNSKYVFIEHSYIFVHVTILDIINGNDIDQYKTDHLVPFEQNQIELNNQIKQQQKQILQTTMMADDDKKEETKCQEIDIIEQQIQIDKKEQQNYMNELKVVNKKQTVSEQQNYFDKVIKAQVDQATDKSKLKFYRKTLKSKFY